MAFRKLTTPSLKEVFVQEVENMILSGELKIGDKLPSERELAESFRAVKSADSFIPVVLVVSPESRGESSRELAEGVLARVTLPLRHQALQHALQQVDVYLENRYASGNTRSLELFRSLVGTSAAVRRVRRMIEQVADKDANVLKSSHVASGLLVLAASAHRAPAFEAASFLMDWLKTRAPFWKRDGGHWVEARASDAAAAARWTP